MHNEELIPRPPIVRERLAESLRETRLLKRLLRLSVDAAKERASTKLFADPNRWPSQPGPASS